MTKRDFLLQSKQVSFTAETAIRNGRRSHQKHTRSGFRNSDGGRFFWICPRAILMTEKSGQIGKPMISKRMDGWISKKVEVFHLIKLALRNKRRSEGKENVLNDDKRVFVNGLDSSIIERKSHF